MAFVNTLVVFATPLLMAAVAGIISERSGVLNIALEGFMLGGAFVSAWVAGNNGSIPLALVLVLVASLVIGGLFGVVVIYLRGDQVAVGIAFNIFMLGATSYGYALVAKHSGQQALQTATMHSIDIPVLGDIGVIGPIFNQPWLTFVGYLLVPVTWILLFHSGLGIRLRACGEYAVGARAAGLSVARWRLAALVASCMIAGLAGSYLVLADANAFINNMSAGKGYIALAVVILGRWNPLGAVLAAALFGGAQALDIQAQGGSILGTHIPVELLQTLPYVVTILAVLIVGRRVRPPAEDGRPLSVA